MAALGVPECYALGPQPASKLATFHWFPLERFDEAIMHHI